MSRWKRRPEGSVIGPDSAEDAGAGAVGAAGSLCSTSAANALGIENMVGTV
jgi:hypothetical protein